MPRVRGSRESASSGAAGRSQGTESGSHRGSARSDSPPLDLKDLTRLIQRASGFPEALAALKNGRAATIDGAWGSAAGLVSAALGLQAASRGRTW